MTDLEIASIELVQALRVMAKEKPLLDQVWYTLEIFDRVYSGASFDQAWTEFADGTPYPKVSYDTDN